MLASHWTWCDILDSVPMLKDFPIYSWRGMMERDLEIRLSCQRMGLPLAETEQVSE